MGRASQEALPSRKPIFNRIGSLEGWYPTPTLTNRASRESRLAPRAPLFYFPPPPFFSSPGGIFFLPPPFAPRAPRPRRFRCRSGPQPPCFNTNTHPWYNKGPRRTRDEFCCPFFSSPGAFFFSGGAFFYSRPLFSRAAPCVFRTCHVSRVTRGVHFRGVPAKFHPNLSPLKN